MRTVREALDATIEHLRPADPGRMQRVFDSYLMREWLTRPTVLASESVMNAIHSSVPVGPSESSWWLKVTRGSVAMVTPSAHSRSTVSPTSGSAR